MNKKEHALRGLKVVVREGEEIDMRKNYLLTAIENYANMQGKLARVVFFNYDDDGSESGVSFFYRND